MLDVELQIKLQIQHRPWEHEPDNEEWVHELTGYKCWVWRHPTLKHLCGYVAVPKGHKMWGIFYDKAPFEHLNVHGGLTYSEEDEKTGEWVLGFDCSHAGDLSPGLLVTLTKYVPLDKSLEDRFKGDTYRDWAWVKEEVCSLARQLKMLDMKPKGEEK